MVAGSGLDWIILRPGLVFRPTAFGGTAMLRGLAGFPLVTLHSSRSRGFSRWGWTRWPRPWSAPRSRAHRPGWRSIWWA